VTEHKKTPEPLTIAAVCDEVMAPLAELKHKPETYARVARTTVQSAPGVANGKPYLLEAGETPPTASKNGTAACNGRRGDFDRRG
jgi:hypothetical protein